MTRPRKPRAKDGLTAEARAFWKTKLLAPHPKPGGKWIWVPAGKVAFLRDVAAHRKNAREGMRKKRARDKIKARHDAMRNELKSERAIGLASLKLLTDEVTK